MGTPIISVERLGKKYSLIHQRSEPYTALRDVMAEKAKEFGRRLAHPFSGARSSDAGRGPEEFWALRNVSFDVSPGERVGIIGRNGAGKSTLLKILSRITEPTEGRAHLRGRVASLLEVGTGFHPELTGRENISLNGAILGMTKVEIRKKFNEIVDFAEVEKFLDTPVKRYSSGMYVRLAFAVAAHLEPEILVVDEVLAVGDAAFQRKCLGKMEDVASREGRTVLFVSHNMAAIQTLCRRAIWLDAGRVERDGESEAVINAYGEQLQNANGFPATLRSLDGNIDIEQIQLLDKNGRATSVYSPGSPVKVEIHYHAKQPVHRPYVWLGIQSQFGALFGANMLLDGARPEVLEGQGCIGCTFHTLPLLPGQMYRIMFGGRKEDGFSALFKATEVTHFLVTGSAEEIGLKGELADSLVGQSSPVLLPYTWELPDGRIVSVNPFQQVQR
jgi:lipopolysaccharide transport system ATP-binding protein